MKIIHIALGKANPNRMNGVNRVVFELASEQTKQGDDVEVWGLTNSQSTNDIERPFKLKVYKRNKFYLVNNLNSDIRVLQNRNDVIFHIHGAFIYDFYLVVKLLVRYSIKYIYTSHGAFNREAIKKNYIIKSLYFHFFERFILKHAYKVHLIAPSEYEYIDILYRNLKNKVLIPNGINIEELKFNFKQIRKNKVPVICFCGRIDIQTKGLDILIDGFEHYVYDGGSGVLWIIGDGKELNQLKDIVNEKELAERVIFYGSKFGEEKLNLIANADAFILTSRNDVFPTAVIEAAGLGKPLMISEETNYGPYVKQYQCGLVLNENIPLAVTSMLKTFESLTDDEVRDMQVYSTKMIEKEFNIESISKKLLEEREERIVE